MMYALGVTRDLGADHAGGIALQLGAAHPADRGTIDHFDIQGAGRRTIVRTGGMPDVDFRLLVHVRLLPSKSGPAERIYPAVLSETARVPCITNRDTPRHWRGWLVR